MAIDARAGQPAGPADLVDVPRLVTAYFSEVPDPAQPAQRVAFGTSGHRGSSLTTSFNEWHIAAITQAICEHRAAQGISGPLFLGVDTHALSAPALATALEVFAGNGVTVAIDDRDDATPTPVISHAIITANRGRPAALADGVVVTPSHNPPRDGGFKYNPPHGGPADSATTSAIERRANELIAAQLSGVRRIPLARARAAATTIRHDYRTPYVEDLGRVVDLEAVRAAGIRIGVDPLGGAGVHYWHAIAERWRLDLTVVATDVDPTFRFMTLDWDGQIRMDPSSPYAMRRLLALQDRFDVAFACDTDHDRHGIVAPSAGLLPPNHYLAVAIDHLGTRRPAWPAHAGVGKTVVSSRLIDRVAARLGRPLVEVPVGFKWFVDGLSRRALAFAGEESAGATFLRQDGAVWTTDKDGLVPGLLAAEIRARTGRDPGDCYRAIVRDLGEPVYARTEAPATAAQRSALARLSPAQVRSRELAGDPITAVLTEAPGNQAPIGGLRVDSAQGWFAARPSGTESIYKIYAESFRGPEHLQRIQEEAQAIVAAALGA